MQKVKQLGAINCRILHLVLKTLLPSLCHYSQWFLVFIAGLKI